MFEGPWKVVEANTLEKMPAIAQGEIVKHKSGAILIKCPKCSALQFTHSEITGSNDYPSLQKRIQCGSGFCKRCAIWFGVNSGKTVLFDGPEERIATPIPERLIKAGVKKAPVITEEE